jgi:hypothetical protein
MRIQLMDAFTLANIVLTADAANKGDLFLRAVFVVILLRLNERISTMQHADEDRVADPCDSRLRDEIRGLGSR